MRINFDFLGEFFIRLVFKVEDSLLKLRCWHPCLNLAFSKVTRSKGDEFQNLYPDPKETDFQDSRFLFQN